MGASTGVVVSVAYPSYFGSFQKTSSRRKCVCKGRYRQFVCAATHNRRQVTEILLTSAMVQRIVLGGGICMRRQPGRDGDSASASEHCEGVTFEHAWLMMLPLRPPPQLPPLHCILLRWYPLPRRLRLLLSPLPSAAALPPPVTRRFPLPSRYPLHRCSECAATPLWQILPSAAPSGVWIT